MPAGLCPLILVFSYLTQISTSSILQGEISTGEAAVFEANSDLVISCLYWSSENESFDGQEISWFFNSTGLNFTDTQFTVISTADISTLTVKKVTFAHSGLYSCKMPEFEEYLSTEITIGIPPEKPKNISCWTRNTVEITCNWQKGADTNLPVTYTFEYRSYRTFSGPWFLCPVLQDNSCYIDTRNDNVPIKGTSAFAIKVTAANSINLTESDLFVFNPYNQVKPYPPTNINVIAISSSEIQLTFHKPDDTETIYLLDYKVRYYTEWQPDQMINLPEMLSQSRKEMNYPLINNLKPYTNYTFQVSCKKDGAYGIWSEWSKPVSEKTWESMPGGLVVIYKVDQTLGSENLLRDVTLYWQLPAERENNGVINYIEINVNQIANNVTRDNTTFTTRINSTKSAHEFSDLLRYVSYNITIKSCNKVGCSGPGLYRLNEDVDKPSEPLEVIAQPLSRSTIKLSWEEPGEPNGLIEEYRIEYFQSDDNSGSPLYLNSEELEVIIEDLETFTRYYFSVQAKTKVGYGGFSPRVSAITDKDAPNAPPQDFEVVTVNEKKVDISWQPPPYKNQRGIITNYTIYYCLNDENGGFNRTSHSTSFPCIVRKEEVNGSARRTSISGLEENKNYSFWLSASTSVGEGPTTGQVHTITKANLAIGDSNDFPPQTVGLAVGITVGVAFVVILLIVLAIYHPIILEKIGVGNYFAIAEPKLPFLISHDIYQYVNAADSWMKNEEHGTKTKYMETFDTLLYDNEPDSIEKNKEKDDVSGSDTSLAETCESCQIQQASGNVAYKKVQNSEENETAIAPATHNLSDDVLLENDNKTRVSDEEVLGPKVRASNNLKRLSGESYSSLEIYQQIGVDGNLIPLLLGEEKEDEVLLGVGLSHKKKNIWTPASENLGAGGNQSKKLNSKRSEVPVRLNNTHNSDGYIAASQLPLISGVSPDCVNF